VSDGIDGICGGFFWEDVDGGKFGGLRKGCCIVVDEVEVDEVADIFDFWYARGDVLS
jgi:hypothetical protein